MPTSLRSDTNEEPAIGNLSLSTKMINNVIENGEEDTLRTFKSNDAQSNEEQVDENISQFTRNLYVDDSRSNNTQADLLPTEQQEAFLKKSQELMKAIKKGEVSADSEKQHNEKPQQVAENEIGSNRFNTTKEKKKNERTNNQGSIIDSLFSPFSWFMGGGSEKPKVEASEKPALETVGRKEAKTKSDEKR